MSEQSFSAAIQMILAGTLSLADLIDTTGTLAARGEIALARQLYKAWIERNREHPLLYIACFNSSALDTQAGDSAAAMDSLNQAIALNGNFMPAYINLGTLLEKTGAPDRAVELWKSVVARPAFLSGSFVSCANTALKQIARVMIDHQQQDSAETSLALSLDMNPRQQDVIEQYIALRLTQCEWPVVVPREQLDRKTQLRLMHPFSTTVYTDDPLYQLASADRYQRSTNFEGPQNPEFDRRNAPIDLNNRKLRVGYVSSDLRDHAIGYLMAEFFEVHSKKNVEVFAYYCGQPSTSDLTNRIKAAVDHWVDIRGLSDDDAARQIAADGIDILVDVNGLTRDARTGLFARRPAPVQVNWLGYPGTMGTPFHHYVIADEWIIPKASELYYSEKVLRLPCYQPNDRKRPVAARPTRRDAGLPDDAIVFCCFNGTHKIGRPTLERWMDIMNRVPGSVLWLLDASPSTRDRLGAFAESKGVARARLVFAAKVHNPLHLARIALADLCLDTVPYGAHTTASDALWMGVPVLTLSGRSFASRVCGSLVRAAGLPELVVTTPDQYVGTAVALGNDRAALAGYRQRLEANRDTSVLFDTDLLVRKLEELYRFMAEEHNKGRTPAPNLDNLGAYLEAAVDFDHEATEMLTMADYDGLYKAKLARLHMARPMSVDGRLWSEADIARAEGRTASAAPEETARRPRRTGTR